MTVLLSGWGCRKDQESFQPYPDTVTELSAFLGQVPDPGATTTFQYSNLSEDIVITTPSGARIFLTDVDQLFASEGSNTPFLCSACTDLKIQVTLVRTNGDILSHGLAAADGDGQLLESDLMLNITAFCGITPLHLLPGRTLKIQAPDASPEDNMFVYTEFLNINGQKAWRNTGQTVYQAEWPAANGAGIEIGYELIVDKLGWVNCGRRFATTSVSSFCLNFQPNYTGLNTKAFLVFENLRVVVPLQFVDSTHAFCAEGIPLGYSVKVVSITKLNADYWLGKSSTETGTNSQLFLQPQKTDPSDLLGYVRSL